MAKFTREESLVRAARLRAIITAALNAQPDRVFKAEELRQELSQEMSNLGYTMINLYSCLRQMAKQELIGHPAIGNYKAIAEGDEVQVAKRKQSKKSAKAPEVSIEIVKSTGKVRLSIKGLVIEIGVSDD